MAPSARGVGKEIKHHGFPRCTLQLCASLRRPAILDRLAPSAFDGKYETGPLPGNDANPSISCRVCGAFGAGDRYADAETTFLWARRMPPMSRWGIRFSRPALPSSGVFLGRIFVETLGNSDHLRRPSLLDSALVSVTTAIFSAYRSVVSKHVLSRDKAEPAADLHCPSWSRKQHRLRACDPAGWLHAWLLGFVLGFMLGGESITLRLPSVVPTFAPA